MRSCEQRGAELTRNSSDVDLCGCYRSDCRDSDKYGAGDTRSRLVLDLRRDRADSFADGRCRRRKRCGPRLGAEGDGDCLSLNVLPNLHAVHRLGVEG
jgi:hypothetical protein